MTWIEGCLSGRSSWRRARRSSIGRKLPKTLRVAIDLAPLEGAGRVEDAINLLAHAARKVVECAADLLRWTPNRAIVDEFKAWLDAEGRHPPRSPIGGAIGYALGQWEALTLFLTDPHLPIDNNASERALHVAALGRNYADLVIMRSSLTAARDRRPFRLAESA